MRSDENSRDPNGSLDCVFIGTGDPLGSRLIFLVDARPGLDEKRHC
jgi:hypothetical protein